jgi:hypothetical protein
VEFLSDPERIALLVYGLSVFVYAGGFKRDKVIADDAGDAVVVHSCRLQNGEDAISKATLVRGITIENRTRCLYGIEQFPRITMVRCCTDICPIPYGMQRIWLEVSKEAFICNVRYRHER